jgi:hypothetical protein
MLKIKKEMMSLVKMMMKRSMMKKRVLLEMMKNLLTSKIYLKEQGKSYKSRS